MKPPPERALFDLVRLSDSSLAIGTFAHSFGLETSIQEGRVRDGPTLEAFLRTELMLRAAPCDLPFLGAAYRAAASENARRLLEIDRRLHAFMHARESREASLQMGRALLDLSVETAPSAFLFRFKRFLIAERKKGRPGGHYLTVLGGVAAGRKIPARSAAVAYLYGFLSSRISVAVRLIPLGQTQAQRILVGLFARCARLARNIEKGLDELSDFAGTSDIQRMRHEALSTKIFRS